LIDNVSEIHVEVIVGREFKSSRGEVVFQEFRIAFNNAGRCLKGDGCILASRLGGTGAESQSNWDKWLYMNKIINDKINDFSFYPFRFFFSSCVA